MDSSIATVPFALLWAAWPCEGRSALAKSLGGSVAAALDDPAEAASADDSLVRLSAALRATGHPVPATALYTTGAALEDAQGFHYMRDSGQAEASGAEARECESARARERCLLTAPSERAHARRLPARPPVRPPRPQALLEKKLGKPRPCKTEADAMGRHGILVFRAVKRGAHGEPISHYDAWNGMTTAEATCNFWKEATHGGGGGVALYEIKA